MRRPFLSVLCPTMRVGGIDVLLHGLAGQTFADFELVLSDALMPLRHASVRHHPAVMLGGMHVTHVEPRGSRFPVAQYCRQMNEALVHARGEVALLITDYTWLPPNLLAAHAQFHAADASGRAGLMGPHRYVALPRLRSDFPGYGEQDTMAYAADVASGRLDAAMVSLFVSNVFGSKTLGADPRTFDDDPFSVEHGARDPKLDHPAGPIGPGYLHCKNASVRLDHLVAINGFDEELDGSHGWQDTNIAERLTKHRCVQWTLDPRLVAQIVNPRGVFPFAIRERPYIENERLGIAKREAGYSPVNAWSIAEERRKMGL